MLPSNKILHACLAVTSFVENVSENLRVLVKLRSLTSKNAGLPTIRKNSISFRVNGNEGSSCFDAT